VKLSIPRLGDTLVLSKPWSFALQNEYRNRSMLAHLGITGPSGETPQSLKISLDKFFQQYFEKDRIWPVALPKSTKLRVDRIYIRKGYREYDSVTFGLVGQKLPGWEAEQTCVIVGSSDRRDIGLTRTTPYREYAREIRFWVKLDAANTIEFKS
jgi:hypothetical protein